ncbi:UDP-N-acetylmuramate dehydrogenase [Algoriphagus namhaensis]|uniref:UDP-N-acetylenolpyruvoylglucosamine reductase n=1 Tax=Algoriphagus namhaensis TaxID=915353 RepID=A0ABV8AUM9_9BACT
MQIQTQVSLKSLNTFGIDQKASFFTEACSVEEVREAMIWAKDQDKEVFILGGGSNILLTQDLDCLVLAMKIKGIEVIDETDEHFFIEVGAGENWHEFVLKSIEMGWNGLENLSLIPGTVGASPMQNIGAYGVEIKEVFHSLKALNRKTLKLETFDSETCEFGYRESIFKNKVKGKYIICSVVFRLSKTPQFNVDYGIIKETLQQQGIDQLTPRSISNAVIEIRQSKLPDPKQIGNAGSFFKNPTISTEQFESLKAENPGIPGYPLPDGVKVPAAWLIEQSGWKGKRFGDIGVHEKQPLVLVNYGNGDGNAIKELAQKVQASVKAKFGVELTPEVNFI